MRRIPLVLCVIATTSVASAQTRLPLDRFEPAPRGDALLSVPDARADGNLEPVGGLELVYARAPLVLRVTEPNGSVQSTTVVDYQLLAHVGAGVRLWKRLVLDLDVPAVVSQSGSGGSVANIAVASANGADFGDVRGGARVTLLDQHASAPALAFASRVWLPTSSGSYAGSSAARWSAQVIAGHDGPHLFWRATTGATVRRADKTYAGAFGSEAFAQIGGGYRLGVNQFGVELLAATGVDVPWFRRNTTGVEALLSVRRRFGPVSAFIGGGPGLTHGAGTPEYRLLAGADLAFELAPGVGRSAGAAGAGHAGSGAALPRTPTHAVVAQPAVDRDGDGTPDASDACPDVPGPPGGARPGCPPDRDGDGIADAYDACPDVRGVKSADPKRNGCPTDSDGDGIPDNADACPEEKGLHTTNPKTNGCPEAIRVVGTQIVITDKVRFATASDVLAPESTKALEEVAKVLRDHPEIARVAVDGHTDDVGQDASNLALSRRRAIAVVRWLVAHGVDERRLEARGFGSRQPLVRGKTAQARATNRRVEFHILKRTDKGKRGWKDGPVDE